MDGHAATARPRRGRPGVTLQAPDKANIIQRAALLVLTEQYDHAGAAIVALTQAHDASTSIGALPDASIPSSQAVRDRIKKIKSLVGVEEQLKSNEEYKARKIDEAWGGARSPFP